MCSGVLIIFFFFSLAPGAYCPEKVNLDRGPQYSLTGKGPSEKINDGPGLYFFFKILISIHFCMKG